METLSDTRMSDRETKTVKKQDIKWLAVLWYIHLHFLGLYGTWLLIVSAKWMTVFFTIFLTLVGCLGVTVGAHRLWAHRTFTAYRSLRFFLILAHTIAGVGSVHDWVLAHRIHHKYHGTDKDPYNHNRGFLYSHYISNFVSTSPDYEKLKIEIDMRDMQTDGFVWMQKTFYWLWFGIFGILLPINAPLEYWDESLPVALCVVGILRLAITVNTAWLVNSSQLIWGVQPGEKLMSILDTFRLLYTLFFKMPKSHGTVVIDGDGVHSKIPCDDNSVFFVKRSYWPAYHYMLPWDWKSGEFGQYDSGCGRFLIKMWHEMGLVSHLQTANSEDVTDALYKVAVKKSTLTDSLHDLKYLSEMNAKQEKLMGRY